MVLPRSLEELLLVQKPKIDFTKPKIDQNETSTDIG